MSPTSRDFFLRLATLDDVASLKTLIAESARGLGRDDYSPEQIEGALEGAWGLDTELIRDGTYFVAVSGSALLGCGGWSRRKTLFGGDNRPGRQSELLDPARDAARIRAFFVHPSAARRGIGRALLERCEAEARAGGFRSAALMATLPGLRLYSAAGFIPGDPIEHPIPGGLTITFVPMSKPLLPLESF